MHWFSSHFCSSFRVNCFDVSDCVLTNVFDSKSRNNFSIVKLALEYSCRSLIGILSLSGINSKELFKVLWRLLCSPKPWYNNLRKVHSVFICEELTIIHNIIEVMMHLLKSRTFCRFKELQPRHRMKRGMIPWFTNNRSQISFHLHNS